MEDVIHLTDFQLAEGVARFSREVLRRLQVQTAGMDSAVGISECEMVKRAITVAAAGKHSLLIVGAKNSGKTMLRALALDLGVETSFEARLCPCGNRGFPSAKCDCTIEQIEETIRNFPIVDIAVECCRYSQRGEGQHGTSLAMIKEQLDRFGEPLTKQPDEFARTLLRSAILQLGVDPPEVERIKRVAETIARLDRAICVSVSQMSEAINYRPLERAW